MTPAIASKYPHRARLRALLVACAEGARSQAEIADDYSRKQLLRYAGHMDRQVGTVDSMGDYE